VVRNIATLLDNLLGEQVRLVTDLDGPSCPIRADMGRMEQVVMNLSLNARDAMPDGGILTIRVRADGPEAVLEVHDTGIGMDEETKARVFEPFFTTKRAGEGTGLGLSTVYGIVEEASGVIDLESEPGQGTKVRIRIPLAEPSAAPEVHRAPESEALPVAGGSERILLVEDQDDLREMASEALELAGYHVTPAPDGESALAMCAGGEAFELLLTDVVMPGLSGGELAERVRQVRPEARVLYMSGYNDDAIVRRGVSVDEASFIQKPFTIEALTRKVRELLDSPPPVAAGRT
jgi:CheY-like chemotaxis protein